MSRYLQHLRERQLPDGSWPYRLGSQDGLAEPTCYSLLAFRAAGEPAPREDTSLQWLESLKRKSGGFAPQQGVEIANWATSLVTLVFLHYQREESAQTGIDWLLGLTGMESGWLARQVRNVLNLSSQYPQNFHGWPWIANTVSWLIPTTLASLALQKANSMRPHPKQEYRIEQSYSMIIERRCDDGGWNHGASAALGVPAPSYPETTGMALLCLQSVPSSAIPRADEVALSMLSETHIASTASWLQLGLQSRGIAVPIGEETAIQCRNTTDFALRVLARCALNGNNVFKA